MVAWNLYSPFSDEHKPAISDRPYWRQAMTPRYRFPLRRLNAALLAALAGAASAQTAPTATLQEVVISANRQEQQSFDAPASIHAVGQDVIETAGPRVNL